MQSDFDLMRFIFNIDLMVARYQGPITSSNVSLTIANKDMRQFFYVFFLMELMVTV